MSLTIYKREKHKQKWRFHATYNNPRHTAKRLQWLRDFLGDVFDFKVISKP